MTLRSTISLEFPDGSVRQIVNHSAGYIDITGSLLSEYYTDFAKLRQLVELGDIHELEKSISDVSALGNQPRVFINFADYVKNHDYEGCEYILRSDGKWYVSSMIVTEDKYVSLSEAVELDKTATFC
jgi:hypothetical protein